MLISRVPGVALRPFVRVLWATAGDGRGERPPRERVLPTGGTHVVFLLGPYPLRLCGGPGDGDAGAVVGHTNLEDLWGRAARESRARLLQAE